MLSIIAFVVIIFSSEFLTIESSAASLSVSVVVPLFGTISTSSPSNYDFVFHTNGSGWYEATGSDGSVAYASTNASFVFNSAMAMGHTFFTMPGDYYLTAPILLPSDTIFDGSGIDSTNFNAVATIGYYTGTDYDSGLFDNNAFYNSNITLQGFTINGNSPTYYDTGIWLENVDYFTIQNVKVNNTYGEALMCNQETNPVYNNTNYVINNVLTYGCGLTGGTNICDSIVLQSISNFSITNMIVNKTGSCGIMSVKHPDIGGDVGGNCSNGFISNCSVYSSQAISWNFVLDHDQNLTLENCYAYGAHHQNYIVAYSSNSLIQNIESDSSGDYGSPLSTVKI